MFNIEDYNYDIDPALIAQVPASNRDQSRLLFLNRENRSIIHHHFFDLPGLLKPGDLIVVNNTRVVPARLYGKKESGGRVEILVLDHNSGDGNSPHRCLLKSSKRPKRGSLLFFEKEVKGIVEDTGEGGLTWIRFSGPLAIDDFLEERGIMPLPPYIKREGGEFSSLDRLRYQTVFSTKKGAVAAPTAGLHFTKKIIERLHDAGITLVELTLHVGHGTFQPVRVTDIRKHNLVAEDFFIGPDTAEAINHTKKEGRRVIAVGTTVVRTLESVAASAGEIRAGRSRTDLLITPGFQFKIIDGLITNFHLPRSSLLFLVSAFGGIEFIREAYKQAVINRYRFYSYGDAMLII
jgi:S-adenosylmethionine:tRNA ribosyltransferase-isomerase